MSRFVLIDGDSILKKAFYHVPIQRDSTGFCTNAIYGFLNVFFELIKEKIDYLTVIFGQELHQENDDAFFSLPEELALQVPVMKTLLSNMNVNVIESDKMKAADVIGTLIKRCENDSMEITVVSGDKNLLQLASEKIMVRLFETDNKKTQIRDYYKKDVEAAYNVLPAQFVQLQALSRIPGIGIKTAADLLRTYDSIENIYVRIDEIGQKSIRDIFSNNENKEKISKFIENLTIDTDGEMDFVHEKAGIGEIFTPEAYVQLQQLSLDGVLSAFRETVKLPETDINKDVSVVEVTAYEDAEKIFAAAAEAGSAAVRILNVKAANAGDYGAGADGQLFLQLQEERAAFGCMLCGASDKAGRVYWIESSDKISAADIKQWISRLLSSENMTVSAFDVKYDYGDIVSKEQDKSLSSHQITKNIFDCKVAAYLLNPLKSDYQIEDVASEYLNIQMQGWSELFGKADTGTVYKNSRKDFLSYFARQSYVLYRAEPILEKALRLNKMAELFRDLEMPLTYVLFDMEREGILVRPEELKIYGEALSGRIEELEKIICEQAGEVFNINSPKQLGEILFEKMKLPGGKKTKTGYSTAADVLEKLAPEYPIVKDILEYRGLAKLKSTYADGLAVFIDADNKIHTNFNQTITATGRLSSTEPNLQNIPMRMELGRRIRKVFVPQEGCIFMDADYSQIELRVLAHMSDDIQLIEAYKMDEDIHRITASKVFHTPFEEVTDLQRRNAKAVNFGIVYGISSFGLSQDLSITPKEARIYIDEYFKTYPGIKRFLDKMVEDAREKGYCETMFGRRRPIPELKSSNFNQRSFGERVAMNSPIQGTAADIIKYAMIHVYDALKQNGLKSKLILQIHDELLIETRNDEVEKVREVLSREMQNACKLAVSLEIDLHTGTDWYEAK